MTKALSPRLAIVLLAAALLAYPLVLSGAFYRDIGVTFLLAAISASAWNIVGGYAGQISVGHAVFFGAGAYAPLLLFTHWAIPPVLGVPLGMAVSIVIAIVIGMPTFRLQGHYFSMATIAVAELIRIVVSNWDFVGAAVGMMGPAVPRTLLDLSFRSAVPYYYIFLAVLACILGLTWFLSRGRMGYYWRAIRAGERAARSLGVPVRRYKLYALMLSAAFTSLAGSLYALMVGFIDPDSGFGSVPGAMVAGLLIGLIQSLSAYYFGPVYKDVVVYGLFVLILWVRPQGLMGKVAR